MLRELLRVEKPNNTSLYRPRDFGDGYINMEHEIRQNIPIFYYNIWDD